MKYLFHLCVLLILTGCDGTPEAEYAPRYSNIPPSALREYVFGVFPLHNPERLQEIFGPLLDYLSENTPGVSFRLEASRNYAAFEEKLYDRAFDFALSNPYQTVNALPHGYQVFGKMGDDDNFRGIILVRKDGPVRDIADLKGKAVAFPAPTALAAALLPQFFLQTHGIDVLRDLDIRYVGSQESSIMNVYLGYAAAGATWSLPWLAYSREHPDMAAQLDARWQTEALPSNGLLVRDDVSPDLALHVKALLLELHQNQRGKLWLARLGLSRFEAADTKTYQPVREFLLRFSRTVYPLDKR
ncbi:MAG: phosphate/phosphite/phosphonate ABC transporter substrate-binding protein [Methylococcaceae bacterium]|nr:MAG: phosphate/phosphite/phosphonate ABC transporter substrate-binding protein [Methylococcaceae bacterium]